MKFMLISDFGNALGAAMRLKAEGNQVAVWVKSPTADSVGNNLVDSIHDWKFTPDFDTVWVFDTTNHGHFADALRLAGYPVIGSSLFEDRLEMDREFARSMMKRAGILVPKSTFFSGWKEGIEFVRAHKGQRFAIKPSDHLSGNLPSHVADEDHPTEDLLGTLDHYKRTFAGDPEYEMQEFIPGIDLSSAGWFNGEDFLKPCYHTREVKATMDGNRGATGGCYSEDTEILTAQGWRSFADVSVGDGVATLNTSTGEMEFQSVSRIWTYDSYRELISMTGKGFDLLVTPDHRMLIENRRTGKYVFKTAEQIESSKASHFCVPRRSRWVGKEVDSFELPGYRSSWKSGMTTLTPEIVASIKVTRRSGATALATAKAYGVCQQTVLNIVSGRRWANNAIRTLVLPPLTVRMDDWLGLLGLYVSEGCVRRRGKRLVGIDIAQSKSNPTKREEIKRILSRLPWGWCETRKGFEINGVQLAAYMEKLGYSGEKFVPNEFLDLCPRQIGILLQALILGDGHTEKSGRRNYFTSSAQLAGQVQEIFQKLGTAATIGIRNRIGHKVNCKSPGIARLLSYEVREYTRGGRKEVRRLTRQRVPYSGKVWCVTVPNGTVYVRRNGKATWCGNCAGNVMWSSDDWVMKEGLYKFEDILRQEHIPLLIDLNCIVDPEREQLRALEWTPRWGFDSEPAIFAVGLDQELGQFLSDMAHGSATEFPMKAGFTAGVRVTIPPYPADDTRAPAGLPILGLSDKDLTDWFYAYDLMKTSDGHLVSAGNCGMIGVACAHDSAAAEAIETATERAEQVKVSEAQFRLDLTDVFIPDLEALKVSPEREGRRERPEPSSKHPIQRLFAARQGRAR